MALLGERIMHFIRKGLFLLSILSASLLLAWWVYRTPVRHTSAYRMPRTPDAYVTTALKRVGMQLYPGAELLDQFQSEERARVPAGDSPDGYAKITTSTIKMVTPDSINAIAKFYGAKAPYVANEDRTQQGVLSFCQLSSVSDIKAANLKATSPIVLITIRKKYLTLAEKAGFTEEHRNLTAKKNPDTSQRHRILELERLLKELTVIEMDIKSYSRSI